MALIIRQSKDFVNKEHRAGNGSYLNYIKPLGYFCVF